MDPLENGCFLLRALGGFIKGQHHPKSVFNLGPKVWPGLNEKPDFQEVFYSGFPVPNGKQQGGAFGAAPKGRRASRAATLGFVVLHLAVETRNKKPPGNRVFYSGPAQLLAPN